MFKRINKALVAVIFGSLILSGGCAYTDNNDSSGSSTEESAVSQQSQEDISDDNDMGDTSESKQSNDIPAEESTDDSTVNEESDTYVEESSMESSMESEDESNNAADDGSSYVETPEESSAAQVSYEGYQFDDEQIVEDYHTATVFTSNDTFNEIFAENILDKEYDAEQQNAGTSSEMRQITASYSAKWKSKVDEVFAEIDGILEDNPDEHEKLIQSQDEWTGGLADVESSFYSEADEGAGTEGLIAAEAAVMNYYKGRAAILLEQIYELNGEIDLAQYGL